MFGHSGYSSDSDSVSSETSDITSRVTTPLDTWSEATSQHRTKSPDFDTSHTGLVDDDQSSAPSSTVESDSTVINKTSNIDKILNSHSNDMKLQNQQQQQQPWINPYWGPNWQPTTILNQSDTNKTNINASTEEISSATDIQQLIPGSILINDNGDIDSLSLKKHPHLKSNTSENSFKPGAEYIADDSGGPGGYLAPTHVQRRIVTSSPALSAHPENHFGYKRSSSSSDASVQSRPAFNRQQTFPETSDDNIQPWVNPYWSKPKQTNAQFLETDNTIQNEKTLLSNNSHQTLLTDPEVHVQTREQSPVSKNGTENLQISAVSPKHEELQQKPCENGELTLNSNMSNDASNKSLSFELKPTLVPAFYERIYPPLVSLPSSIPTSSATNESKLLHQVKMFNNTVVDDDDMSYTIDSQGVIHYRELTPSNNQKSPLNLTSATSTNTQQSITRPQTRRDVSSSETISTALSLQQNSSTSPSHPNKTILSLFPTLKKTSLPSVDYFSPSSSSSTAILTEADLDSIQEAFHLLQVNPDAIPIIEAPTLTPSTNASHSSHPMLSFDSLFTANNSQQPQQKPTILPPSSLFTINALFNTSLQKNKSNSQSSPSQSSSSFAVHSKVNSSLFTFNGNPQQNPTLSSSSTAVINKLFNDTPSNIALNNSQPSPVLVSCPLPENKNTNSSSYTFNADAEQYPSPLSSSATAVSKLFSTAPVLPSSSSLPAKSQYDSQQPLPWSSSTDASTSDETLRFLTAQGSIVLI